MEVAIVFVIGLLIGLISMDVISRIDSIGTLRVDDSLPDEGPYLFLELTKDINHIRRKKYIVLKVNTDSYIPHE